MRNIYTSDLVINPQSGAVFVLASVIFSDDHEGYAFMSAIIENTNKKLSFKITRDWRKALKFYDMETANIFRKRMIEAEHEWSLQAFTQDTITALEREADEPSKKFPFNVKPERPNLYLFPEMPRAGETSDMRFKRDTPYGWVIQIRKGPKGFSNYVRVQPIGADPLEYDEFGLANLPYQGTIFEQAVDAQNFVDTVMARKFNPGGFRQIIVKPLFVHLADMREAESPKVESPEVETAPAARPEVEYFVQKAKVQRLPKPGDVIRFEHPSKFVGASMDYKDVYLLVTAPTYIVDKMFIFKGIRINGGGRPEVWDQPGNYSRVENCWSAKSYVALDHL